MKQLNFSKYSGAGNDFILVDDRLTKFPIKNSLLIQKLCHRHHGIGADGIILLQTSPSLQLFMRILNADGSEGEMCGNGLRCLAHYLLELDLQKQPYTVETLGGIYQIHYEDERIATHFPLPIIYDMKLTMEIEKQEYSFSHLNTGVPHIVCFVTNKEELESVPLAKLGPKFRYHSHFTPQGTNVNFAFYDSAKNCIYIRTYERGVEAETLACGTGMMATALAAHFHYSCSLPVDLIVRSGDCLTANFNWQEEKKWFNLSLTGKAEHIFCGTINI